MIGFVKKHWVLISDILVSLGSIGAAMQGTIDWTEAGLLILVKLLPTKAGAAKALLARATPPTPD